LNSKIFLALEERGMVDIYCFVLKIGFKLKKVKFWAKIKGLCFLKTEIFLALEGREWVVGWVFLLFCVCLPE